MTKDYKGNHTYTVQVAGGWAQEERVHMFDANGFKRSVKDWMRQHPSGSEAELIDYCEELIPPKDFAANRWLIDHTVSWYRHVLAQRKLARNLSDDEGDAMH